MSGVDFTSRAKLAATGLSASRMGTGADGCKPKFGDALAEAGRNAKGNAKQDAATRVRGDAEKARSETTRPETNRGRALQRREPGKTGAAPTRAGSSVACGDVGPRGPAERSGKFGTQNPATRVRQLDALGGIAERMLTTRPWDRVSTRGRGQDAPAAGLLPGHPARPDKRATPGEGARPRRPESPPQGQPRHVEAARTQRSAERLADCREVSIPGGGAADPGNPSTAAGQPLRRLFASDYSDGRSAPAGADRPSAREVSNAVSAAQANTPNSAGASDLFWVWGQFLDHDLDLVETGSESMPIAVPAGDAIFDPSGTGTATLPFKRSTGVVNADGRLQQVNEITALIDAGNVYGSDASTTDYLRSHEGGKLRTSVGDFMPNESGFWVGGDARANENTALSAMHTLFVREHNRIAGELAADDPSLGDEEIFQKARALVTAQIQAITFNEFLPLLLGDGALGPYRGYTGIDAQVSNAFAAAAFRFGHTLVSDTLTFLDDTGASTEVPLAQAFFNPQLLSQFGVDAVFRGLAGSSAQQMDTQIVDSLRNMVLNAPGSPRMDLAALNIQRGRDHGLPTLNMAREALGLDALCGFDDPRLRDGVGAQLASTYDSIDDVDLWVGLLAERPVGSSQVGQTQTLILADQFARLRDGDPNWYERRFDAATVAQIDATSLADIIKRNTTADEIDDTAMLA